MARMMSTMDCMPRTNVPHFRRLATGQKKFIVVAYSKRKSRRNEPSDALTVTSLPVLEGEFVPLAVQQRNVKTATIETPCDDNLRLSLQEFLDSQKENVVDEHILSSPDVLHEVAKGNEDENDKLDNGVEEELDIDDAEEENFDELEGLPTLKKKGVPAVMRCFDRAKIFVKAGDGGKGEVAFRREKYIPFGGPCGGNGGKGGNVYVEVDRSLNSLLLFRKNIHFRAGRGAHGLGKSQHGGSGTDCVIKVPPGTLVREQSSSPGCGKLLLELTKDGQKELLLLGGRGGRGNAAFKSGRNSSPQIAEKGEAGPEMWIELELKLVADVGIIGVPNAGKSTLLSAVSAAKPTIAAYPFTTLLPNLGVVSLDIHSSMVLADLPGLLEGAHLGFGLGHEFLRHTERCRVLIHVIDGNSPQPEYEYEAVRLELQLFNPVLSHKPYVVAYNKMDLPDAAQRWPAFQKHMESLGVTVVCMSAATMDGTLKIMYIASELLKTAPLPTSEEEPSVDIAEMLQREKSIPIKDYNISGEDGLWFIKGAGLERFAQMTNWEYFESVQRFESVLETIGAFDELRERGIEEGDCVVVGKMEFFWHDTKKIADSKVWQRGARGSKKWPH